MALTKSAVLSLRLEGFEAAEKSGKAIANAMAVADAFVARLTRQSGQLAGQLVDVASVGTHASASVRAAFLHVRTAAQGASQGLAQGYAAMLRSLETSGARSAATIHGRCVDMLQAVAQASRGATAVASKAFGDVGRDGLDQVCRALLAARG